MGTCQTNMIRSEKKKKIPSYKGTPPRPIETGTLKYRNENRLREQSPPLDTPYVTPLRHKIEDKVHKLRYTRSSRVE